MYYRDGSERQRVGRRGTQSGPPLFPRPPPGRQPLPLPSAPHQALRQSGLWFLFPPNVFLLHKQMLVCFLTPLLTRRVPCYPHSLFRSTERPWKTVPHRLTETFLTFFWLQRTPLGRWTLFLYGQSGSFPRLETAKKDTIKTLCVRVCVWLVVCLLEVGSLGKCTCTFIRYHQISPRKECGELRSHQGCPDRF